MPDKVDTEAPFSRARTRGEGPAVQEDGERVIRINVGADALLEKRPRFAGTPRRPKPRNAVERAFDEWWAERSLTYKYDELALDAATVNQEVDGKFNELTVLKITGGEITVRFNREDADAIPLDSKIVIRQAFDKLYLSWAASAGNTVRLLRAWHIEK